MPRNLLVSTQHRVNGVPRALVLGEDLPLLHLGDQGVDKGETLAVGFLYNFLVSQIDVALDIGSSLGFTALCNRGIHHSFQPFCSSGDGLYHRAAQLRREGSRVNGGLLLGVNVAFVEGNHHGDAQFQQLGREEQAAAQVGGIHNVDDGIE